VKLHNLGDRVELRIKINNKSTHYINMPRPAPVSFELECDPETPKNVVIFIKR
jgi:hypothetical protein